MNYCLFTATGQNRFKSRTSNVLPVVTVSGGESAVALVSPAGSSVPSQPATEPDTSSANAKSRQFENGKWEGGEDEDERLKFNCDSFSISVLMHVNHNCSCGPYFDPRKVKAMPAQFGSGPMLTVTRDIFQALLMAAISPRQMLNLLKRGEGESISVTLESKPTSVRLPVFLEEDDFYNYIRRQLEDLCACEHMLYKQKEVCTKCPVQSTPLTKREDANSKAEKRRWSSDSQQNPTTTANPLQTSPGPGSTSIPTSPTAAKQPRKPVLGKNFHRFSPYLGINQSFFLQNWKQRRQRHSPRVRLVGIPRVSLRSGQ